MNTDALMDNRLRSRPRSVADTPAPFLSIVVPALNEEENIRPLIQRLHAALGSLTESYEIILVSDGSDDRTCELVEEQHALDARVKLLHLSRSFGHQNAILAGLDHAHGRVVVTMDADLQHPPEAIADLLAEWETGADVVHAVRHSTHQGNIVIRQCKRLGYALLGRLCEVDIVPQSADFRLYDRRAARTMRRLRERSRFNRGLARWIGFRQAIVYVDENERLGGVAKYSFIKLLRLLMDGMFSLSSKPLQYMGTIGLMISGLSGLSLATVLVGYMLDWPGFRAITGWASTVSVILCVGGIQLTALWLIGQYLGRTYEEVKHRPAYVIAAAVGIDSDILGEPDLEPRRIPRHA